MMSPDGLELFDANEALLNVPTGSHYSGTGYPKRIQYKVRASLGPNAIPSSLLISPESASTYHYYDCVSLTPAAREALTVGFSRITRRLAEMMTEQLLTHSERGDCSEVLDISSLEEPSSDLKLLETRVSQFTSRAQRVLSAEPNLLADLIGALNGVAECDVLTGLPTLDAYSDRDSSGPPTVRIIVHAPETMSWEDQMELWDDLAERVGQALKDSSHRLRIIVSVEPE